MAVAIELRNLRVRSLSLDFNDIAWEIEPTREDLLDYTFQVFRSEAPAGPWGELSVEMEDQYLFVDNTINPMNRWREYFYLVRVKHKPSGTTKDFGPASKEPKPDLIALEMRKNFNLLMTEFVGRKCWILPARTFGQRCVACWDPTLKQRTKSGCRTCYDTSFVRGFHTPIETFLQFDPSPKNDQQTNTGLVQQVNTTARVGYFPPLKPGDVIIEPENRRWKVTQVNATERLRAIVHQEIQAHEVPRGDILYALELDLGVGCVKTSQGVIVKPIKLRDILLVSSRNYTNPQTLTAFERGEMDDVFSLYKRVPK